MKKRLSQFILLRSLKREGEHLKVLFLNSLFLFSLISLLSPTRMLDDQSDLLCVLCEADDAN